MGRKLKRNEEEMGRNMIGREGMETKCGEMERNGKAIERKWKQNGEDMERKMNGIERKWRRKETNGYKLKAHGDGKERNT